MEKNVVLVELKVRDLVLVIQQQKNCTKQYILALKLEKSSDNEIDNARYSSYKIVLEELCQFELCNEVSSIQAPLSLNHVSLNRSNNTLSMFSKSTTRKHKESCITSSLNWIFLLTSFLISWASSPFGQALGVRFVTQIFIIGAFYHEISLFGYDYTTIDICYSCQHYDLYNGYMFIPSNKLIWS